MPEYVTGLREAVRDLEKLGVDLDDLKDAFAAIASQGAEEAARFVRSRSGRLAASVRGNRAKGRAVITAGRATVRYAGPVNYGWKRRHIRGQGFLQKADAVIGPEAVTLLERGIGKAIEKRGF